MMGIMPMGKLTTACVVFLLAACAGGIASAAPATSLTVVKVTNLADSGTGSLRDCVSKAMPRICVFEVSGRISLKEQLFIKKPDLIIAGQTAPSPGIVLTGAGILAQADNVRVEHLSVRVGDAAQGPDPEGRDAISVWGPGTTNVVYKNISASWAIDENFSTWDSVYDVRVEDSIISEALYHSIHPEGPHSMGALVGVNAHRVSFVGNLFAANNDRNVRWRDGSDGAFLGNVVYGWGGDSSWNITNVTGSPIAKPVKLDIIGNVFLPGPDGLQSPFVIYAESVPSGSRVYISDNLAPKLTNLLPTYLSSSRVGGSEKTRQPAAQTFNAVMSKAGSRPWDRNPIDRKVLDGVLNRNLRIRDRVTEWPVVAQNTRKISSPSATMTLEQVSIWLKNFEGASTTPAPPPQVSATPTSTFTVIPEPTQSEPPSATPTPDPTATPTTSLSPIPVATERPNPFLRPETPGPGPDKVISVNDKYPWLTSMRAWRRRGRELCCTTNGRKKLKHVLAIAQKPALRRRCMRIECR